MEINNEVIKREILKLKKEVLGYKTITEANIVGMFYKNIDNLRTSELSLKDFNDNTWKVYYAIANEIVIKEKKEVLDDITIGLFLEKHPKLKDKYDEYKGYSTINDLINMVDEKNYDGYIQELHKWGTVLTLLDRGFFVDIKECIDMSLPEIYDLMEAMLNDSFVSNTSDEIVGSFDISHNIDALIEELDKGLQIGMPYDNMPLLNSETGGMLEGDMVLIGGLSGGGKSTFVRSAILPSAIKYGEKVLCLINEEGLQKWQSELIVWVANNIFKYDVAKWKVRNGSYTKELKEQLYESATWLKENSNKIIVIPFKRYRTSTAIKLLRKYHAMGVNTAIIDTMKPDSNADLNNTWMSMMQGAVSLYDTIKRTDKTKGMRLICTFQLSKGQTTRRYFSQDSIGIAKNIIDVASQCLMIRNVLPDEFSGGKHEIKVFKLAGKNNSSKIPVELDESKHYSIVFIPKNRGGSSEAYQIVYEADLSKNIYKEIGICNINPDF